MVTAVVILATAGVVVALLARAKHLAAAPSHSTRVVSEPVPAGARPAARSEDEDRRADFASRMERRLRDQGKGITVKALALGRRTLEINWTVRADREHIESLKRAKPLRDQLRSLGFTKMMFKVREREVYLTALTSPH